MNRILVAVLLGTLVAPVAWAQSATDGDCTVAVEGGGDTALTREQRGRIQERLNADGFAAGAADGIFGPRTRKAIRDWQAERGTDTTGCLTEGQARALLEGGGAPAERQAEDAAAVAALSPKCAELLSDYPEIPDDSHAEAQCWQELDEQPGCYVYRDEYHTNDYIVGKAECSGGVVKRATLTIETIAGSVSEGRFVDGKRNGLWVERRQSGYVYKGSYVDGRRAGEWSERIDASGVYRERTGTYVNGERSGYWHEQASPGVVTHVGSYVNGKRHGRWAWFYPDFCVTETYSHGVEIQSESKDGKGCRPDVL